MIVFLPYENQIYKKGMKLLQEERSYLPVLAIAVVIPLTSTSSIVRSYFFGKQQMFPHVFSNCLEDIVRLFLMFTLIPLFLPKGLEITVTVVILSNVIIYSSPPP